MKKLKGTETAVNLMKAFAGESQARNRYTFFAAIAEKEGYKQIKNIFLETADNERAHAWRFYKFLIEGFKEELPAIVRIEDAFPVALGTTLDNLRASAGGENEEWVQHYPHFAEIAAKEGFTEISAAFKMVAAAEKRHETRFNKLADNLENKKVFKKDSVTLWKCGNCGYIHEGEKAPEACPACIHPQAFFEVWAETY